MGSVSDFDLTALYDESKSLSQGALTIPGYSMDGWYGRIFDGAGFDMNRPIGAYTKKDLDKLLYGEPTKIKVEGVNLTYEGVIPKIQKSMLSKDVDAMQPHIRASHERAITFQTCPECDGTRLTKEVLASKIQGKNIADLCALQISDLADWVRELDEPWVAPLLTGLRHLLDSFAEIGLGYLSLDRPAGTLSGGEAQRAKMIRHLGSSLTDTTYVFDEPTIGLHPRRHRADEQPAPAAARQGQHGARRGAQAGDDRDRRPRRRPRTRRRHRGRQVSASRGTVDGLRDSDTITGRHLGDRAKLKESVRSTSGPLEVRGASTRRPTKDVDVDIPLGVLCVVTGVAGSGKSSLIHGSVADRDGVVVIDRGAIRGSRRSNPATYTGLLDPIRRAFAKANGVKPALFSSNSEGACSTCNGAGVIYTELGVMATVESTCEECEGKRFQASVLEYTLGGKNITEVLAMPVTEAREFFGSGEAATPAAHKILDRLADVGLGYVSLGQPVDHAVRGRAAAAQAGHPDGREGRRVHPGRADRWPAPGRRRAPARTARPTRRRRPVGGRHRAPPSGHGARRLDHRPRTRRRPRWRTGHLRGHAERDVMAAPSTLTGKHLAAYVA